ncbi:MAG: hypothetical protein IT567_03340 [Alphaproteobacteria bacterium]|nr:hypothetical protein [Alphaproteobacteria bacterium]
MRNSLMASVCSLAALCAVSEAMADAAMSHDMIPAPAGIMGDHVHPKGKWMLSYHHGRTARSGFKDGDGNVSDASVLTAYGEAATKMDMDMHMLEGMAGLTDRLTLMVMAEYMEMGMTHRSLHGMGHLHTMTHSGWGDTKVTGVYQLAHKMEGSRMHVLNLNAGASLPTASTDEAFFNHHGERMHAPYNMQFGSGTVDPIIGLTYTGSQGDWGWGAQTLNTLRVGTNDEGYRQGNKYDANLWVSRRLSEMASVSLRLEGNHWGNVHGEDPQIPLGGIAGSDPDGTGGDRIRAHAGFTLAAGEGALKGQSLGVEAGLPLYERFDGPQLSEDYSLTAKWKISF